MRRIGNIVLSLLMVACCVLLMGAPDSAIVLVAFVLGIWLLASGLKSLVYYFTMARHMVGGLRLLFIALITIDIGGFVLLFIYQPKISIVLYLVGYNMFTAIIGIVRVVESKMVDSHWKASLFHSIVNIALAIACIAFINSDQVVIAVFCIGLFYQACVRFVRAIRPTEIIYIK